MIRKARYQPSTRSNDSKVFYWDETEKWKRLGFGGFRDIGIKGRGTAKLACKLHQIVNLCPVKFFQNFLIKAITQQRGMEKNLRKLYEQL